MLSDGFVRVEELPGAENIRVFLRMAGPNNFLGCKANGYTVNNTIILTKQAAEKVVAVQKEVENDGYDLVVYDAYRPAKAVAHFVEWSKNVSDTATKEIFYPHLSKEEIFDKGLIAERSSHSRGSTIDLTLIEKGEQLLFEPIAQTIILKSGRQITYYHDNTVNMGSSFDYFDDVSAYDNDEISDEQYAMRAYLQEKMVKHGFEPYPVEWWHFTLSGEPFPDNYFDFDIE